MHKLTKTIELMGELLETSLFLLHPDNKTFEALKYNSLHNPLHLVNKVTNIGHTEKINHQVTYPRIRKSDLFERFILLSLTNQHKFVGTFVIGPFLPSPLSDNQLAILIKDRQAYSIQNQVNAYYQMLPICPTDKLVGISRVCHHLLTGNYIDETLIKSDYQSSLGYLTNEKKITYTDFSTPHVKHDQLFESEILKVVKNGQVALLKKDFFVIDEEQSALYSRASYLRSLKNHLITLVTLVSRTAIDGGLMRQLALVASDEYILKIEEADSVDRLYRIASDMLTFFTTKVNESQTHAYSSIVVQAINYIQKNIYTHFHQRDIAEFVAVSPNYLSFIFKKETGETLTSFIQQTHVTEAKHILTTSTISISDISDLLLFSDQSYFTKIFKKHTGFPPKLYRKKFSH